MNFTGQEWEYRSCIICGEHLGSGFDHSECSRAKKALFAEASENKAPRKRLSKRAADEFAKYMSGTSR